MAHGSAAADISRLQNQSQCSNLLLQLSVRMAWTAAQQKPTRGSGVEVAGRDP